MGFGDDRYYFHRSDAHKVGERGALPCMGQIRSPQFLVKLLPVYAPENSGVFRFWQTIVQRIKLQSVCNHIGENSRYVF